MRKLTRTTSASRYLFIHSGKVLFSTLKNSLFPLAQGKKKKKKGCIFKQIGLPLNFFRNLSYRLEVRTYNIASRAAQSNQSVYVSVRKLTNRFHVAVRLLSNRSQMTSKCGKNKRVAHEAIAECATDVLATFLRLL